MNTLVKPQQDNVLDTEKVHKQSLKQYKKQKMNFQTQNKICL